MLNEKIKTFLLVGIFRNYVAHDYFKAYKTLEDEYIFFEKIINVIWLCWLKVNKLKL